MGNSLTPREQYLNEVAEWAGKPRPFGEVLDEMDHEAKYQPATIDTHREQELRIQALGAAISRRDWRATERAYEAIRDKFAAVSP